jgi:hypothetical protein
MKNRHEGAEQNGMHGYLLHPVPQKLERVFLMETTNVNTIPITSIKIVPYH